jgi:hypothetical protein
MTRTLAALLLALGLLLTGACDSSQSGGSSNPDSQVDEEPGDPDDRTSEEGDEGDG